MQVLGKRIVDRFAFEHYGNSLNVLNSNRLKHTYEPAQLNYACTSIGRSMKGVDWQKTELTCQWKNDSFI